jgi:hypothetical protein
MTSTSETRIHAWGPSPAADADVQTMLTFLAGTLGVVLVMALAWAVLFVVR